MQPLKHQPKKRVSKPRGKPQALNEDIQDPSPETREDQKEKGIMAMQKFCPPLIGQDPNFVTRVGLGKLRVISADGLQEEGNA
jgi:hypothetical protein